MIVAIDRLREALELRARDLGFGPREATLLADHYLDAELRGSPGHGAERLRWLAGLPVLQPGAHPVPEGRAEGLVRYHGNGAVGYVALAEALDAELERPPDGARLVVVADCFPTGRLGYYAERVARRGLLCLLTATSTPRIVHPQGGPPLLGTNPLCLAMPAEPAPLVIDVSMGRVTYGDVLAATARRQPLPPGAAVRPDRGAERDPAAVTGDRAGIVPFGGEQSHKAFALAALVELLVGGLAGLDGHAAVALLAAPAAEPVARLRALADGRRLPGDAGTSRRDHALARGTLELPDDLWEWLAG
jgi:LDH2 family malate/lactate/ureidoglycolate dehydrogenase